MDSLKKLYHDVFPNEKNSILNLPNKLNEIPKVVQVCAEPTYKLEKLQFAAQDRVKVLSKEDEIYLNREKQNFKEQGFI